MEILRRCPPYQENNILKRILEKEDYNILTFEEILIDETKKVKKIKKGDYLSSGKYQIVDQGQSYLGGYTNIEEGIYARTPFLVFGDHTRVIKYIDKPSFIGADGVKVINIKESMKHEIDIKYTYYYLKYSNIPNDGYSRHFKYIKNLLYIVPPLDIQKQIVEVLDKAQSLIDKREKQIKLLNNLIESVFYDMFGDPVLNDKGWAVKRLGDESMCIVPARDKPRSFTGYIPWITINDLEENGHTLKSKEGLGLTKEEISEVKRKVVPKGSVLMSCVGNLGITSINGAELVINQQIHAFKCNDNLNNYYLKYYIPKRIDYLNKVANSTTVKYINKTKCENIPLLLPPLNLQNQFAEKVQAIEKQKQLLEDSLKLLEDNYNCLMQRAFKGELF